LTQKTAGGGLPLPGDSKTLPGDGFPVPGGIKKLPMGGLPCQLA